MLNLYHDTETGPPDTSGLYLRIDDYYPDLSNNEFYLRTGDDALYRAGQVGGVLDTTTTNNIIYRWGGAIGAPSPFTDGTEITVQVFAE